MNIETTFITAVRAISKNKMRAVLTSIGIIIGVSSVIMMIGIAKSAQIEILGKIKTFGYNAVAVFGKENHFQINDLETIKKTFGDIRYVSPVCHAGERHVQNGRYNYKSVVCGANNEYFLIKQRTIVKGREFTQDEIYRSDKVAVIGKTVTTELFNGSNPIGKRLVIENVPYIIIGELDSMGESLSDYDNDNEIVIPYTTANQKFFYRSSFTDFYVSVWNENGIDTAIVGIQNFIRKKFHIPAGQEDTFELYTSKEKIGMAADISKALGILLAGVASISLLVGGIGIMNIMLVSVTERTREIGIRMAIGAKRRDILLQFLIESVTLSSGGGIAGIFLGLLIYYIVTVAVKWPFIFSFMSVAVSFSFAAFIGIFFGFWPARKAAGLKPIDALKFE
ncbi:MAG: ABC transporter permease [Leptospirales bacterium]|nr:ABC transporter permease [Leptospirales bacterium]